MEDLIALILQFLFELLLEVLINIPFDLPSKKRNTPERTSISLVCFCWFLTGGAIGWLSLLIFQHTFITIPVLRIANLILAPLLSASLSKYIATRRAEINGYIVPRNHYWQAFWFTLAFTMVRFVYATHT